MEGIKKSIIKIINQPFNDKENFELAYLYENEGQYAAAVSFYLRCAEFSTNKILICESLIRASLCITKQKGRDEKELYLIKHAISVCPDALEARFIFCLYNSWRGNWLDCYTEACTALNIETNKKFIKDISYEGKISFLYQKALSGIEIGKINEGREIYINLLQNFELREKRGNIISRYNKLPQVSHKPIYYDSSKNIGYKFDNYKIIDKNYMLDNSPRKIIDCFIFYNELDLLNYRLNILDECVDYFVLVEATHTHVGKEKELIYKNNKKLFEKFQDKIIHIIVDDFPYKYPNIDFEKSEQWENEIFQRNCIKLGINKLNLNDNDVIIISDLDEIPNPEVLNKIKHNNLYVSFHALIMDFYYFNLNCKQNLEWNSSKIITYLEYKNINLPCHNLRIYPSKISRIKKGGWHLSYFGNTEFIKKKIQNFTHQEFNNNHILDNIEERIKSNKDIFNRAGHDIKYINIKDNDFLPPLYDKYLKKFYSTSLGIKDFVFFPHYDEVGNDIIYYPNKSLKELIQIATENEKCIGFNTQGFFKEKIDLLKKNNNSFGKNEGIYIKKKNTIPVFGTLVCITTKWLKKQLESIDYPIENYIIINNNGNGVLDRELNEIVEKKHPFIKNLNVYHMPCNIGVAGGWNMIIKSFMLSSYWIIANDDVSFTPGFLEIMNNSAQGADVGMVHGGGGYKNMGSFDLFLIKDWVIKSHGLFDENYYPAYFEDVDYIMRIINKPFKRIMNLNELGFVYYHGDTIDYNKSGANTQKSSKKMENAMKNVREKNKRYFMQKWGGEEDCDIYFTENPYKTPFNKNNKVDTFDLDFVRSKYIDKSLFICKKPDNFKFNNIIKPNLIVIDNFYKNPYDIRKYALNLEYKNPGQHGAVGFRCEKGRKVWEGTKEYFEKLLHKKIPSGDGMGEWEYSTNGCFQWCPSGTSLVYHTDSQEYAGILYLTPDAPPNCGTSFFRHKKYKSMCGSEVFSNDDWHDPKLEYKDWFTDSKPWEKIDSVGNVFNRLVIFKSYNIHAVTEYFGETINNSRLFQLFFFNLE